MLLTVLAGEPVTYEEVEALVNQASDDRSRADILNAEARKKRNLQPSLALILSKRASEYARRTTYTEGLAEAMSNAGLARYNLAQYEEALAESTEALLVYASIGDKNKEASLSSTLAGILFRLGRYDRALEYLSTALNIREELNDIQGMASIHSNISNTYQAIGQFDIALEHLLKALEIQEEINDNYGIAITANNIGGIYFQLGHTETALKYLQQALGWFRDGDNLHDTAKTLCNIGNMFAQIKDFKQALDYQCEALSLAKTLNDQQNTAATILSMGRTYSAQGETATALSYFATALKIMRDISDKQGELEAMRYIGDIYNAKYEHKRALRYYNQGIQLAQQIHAMNEEATFYDCASRSLELMKEYENALKFYRKASSIRSSILASDKEKLISVMEIRLNIERASRDREIYRLRNVELADAINALQEKSDALSSAYHDIEQQQQVTSEMNVQLEHANSMLHLLNQEKNDLLGIVTHDMKNLVTGIKLAAEGIRRYDKAKEDALMQTTSKRIINASNDITNLIVGLLDINALETGKISFRSERVDVALLTRNLIENYRPNTEQKQLSVLLTHEVDVFALADKERLTEAIDNLVSNAIKYSPKGQEVRLHVQRSNGMIRCMVADSGQGFTEYDKKHLFQKFMRLSARPTGGESSTGLGLSIAKKLVENMKGRIWLESEHGQGATFYLEVPVYAGD